MGKYDLLIMEKFHSRMHGRNFPCEALEDRSKSTGLISSYQMYPRNVTVREEKKGNKLKPMLVDRLLKNSDIFYSFFFFNKIKRNFLMQPGKRKKHRQSVK